MYLEGPYWDGMHCTFNAHVDGLYSAAKMAKLESAKEWLKAARRYHRDGQEDRATWAAINGAAELSQYWNANCIGYIGGPDAKQTVYET